MEGDAGTAEATKDYDAALAIGGDFTSALYNMAVAMYEKIIAINPQASTSFPRLGLLQDKKGDHAKALASFRAAVAIDATHSTPCYCGGESG